MYRTNFLFAFFLIVFLGLAKAITNRNTSGIKPPQVEWTGSCTDASSQQSPININGPFSFMNMEIDIVTHDMSGSGAAFLQNSNNELLIKGDFGYITHDSTVFSSYEIAFKSPSEHSVGNSQTFFPLEMQVKLVSSTLAKLNVAILFSYGEENQLLSHLGFGRGVLKNLSWNQNFEIPQSFNIKSILPIQNRFFIYKGSDTSPPCEPTIWLIGYDTLKVSTQQMADFPKELLYSGRDVQKSKSEIYINFNIQKTQESETKNSTTSTEAKQLPHKTQNSFILLGDDTIYDPFVYGHNEQPSTKYIKDSDYIVVHSTWPSSESTSQNTHEENMLDKIEDIVFKNNAEKSLLDQLNEQSKKAESNELKKSNATTTAVPTNSTSPALTPSPSVTKQVETPNSITSSNTTSLIQQVSNEAEDQSKSIPNEESTWPPLCHSSRKQSPVLLDGGMYMKVDEISITIAYDKLNDSPALVSDGVKLSLVGSFGTINIAGDSYKASIVHFKIPAEHRTGQTESVGTIEFQIQHENSNSKEGKIVMVSVIAKVVEGAHNRFLDSLGINNKVKSVNKIENFKKLDNTFVSLNELVTDIKHYYRYDGSLSHPPCSENVTWIVKKDFVEISEKQLEVLRDLLGKSKNSRKPQPIFGRYVFTK